MTRSQVHDLQAVVLCGPGHRLVPLVNEEKLPKCLLPIANRPMIYYTLCWLIQAGITVAHSAAASRLQLYFNRIFDLGKVDLVLLDEYQGTMHALLSVKSKLKGDFLAVSCDLITDFPLSQLIEKCRMSTASMVALMATPQTCCFGQQPKESTEPKHRLMDEEGVMVGLDEDATRLLSWMSRDELEEATLTISMPLLARYPHVRLRSDLHDMHCFLFRKALLEDAHQVEKISKLFSIREDLIPRLVGRQFGSKDHYRCEVVVADKGYCVRANTLSALAESGKQLARILGVGGLRLVSQAAEIGQKTQIGADSMIGVKQEFGIAIVLLFLFSFLYEGLLTYRAKLDQRMLHSHSQSIYTVPQNITRSTLHGFSYYISQVLMMVFMAYNGYFCASLVLGRAIGYFFFAHFFPSIREDDRPKSCCG